MITIMGLVKSRREMRVEDIHEPAPGVRGPLTAFEGTHTLNVVVDRTQKAINHARGPVEIDCISQFVFANLSQGLAAAGANGFEIALGVEEANITDIRVVTALQNTVVAPPTTTGALKRMSLLRKRADVSSQEFQDQWLNMHAVLVKRLPGVLGYRQNLVLDGADANTAIGVDGVVELWFENAEAVENAFRSERGHTLMAHAKEFIAEITTFLVMPVETVHRPRGKG